MAIARARSSDGFIDDDTCKPGGQLRVAPKGAHRPVRQQPRFLYRVLSLGVILENAARRAIKRLVIAAHEQVERIFVAACNPPRDVGVGQSLVGRFQHCLKHGRLLIE